MMTGYLWIALISVFYFLVLRVLSNLAFKARLRLHLLGQEILDDEAAPEWVRESTRLSMMNAMAFRSAFSWITAIFTVTYADLIGDPARQERRAKLLEYKNEKLDEFAYLYFISTAAANPLVGFISFILALLATFLVALKGPVDFTELREDVALRASTTSGWAGPEPLAAL